MIYSRCSCRDDNGRAYGNLPENPTSAQIAKACPALVEARESGGKHGKWGFYLSRGFDASGKRRQTRVANFDTKRAAQSALAKARTLHDQGEFVETSRVRFADWLDEWLDAREQRGDIKRTTLDNYRRYVDADIKPSTLGRLRLTEIKRPDVRRFVDGLNAAGRGPTTVRRIVAVVQGALTAALRDDIIASNPARGVRLPTVETHEFEPWSPVQVGAFLDHAASRRTARAAMDRRRSRTTRTDRAVDSGAGAQRGRRELAEDERGASRRATRRRRCRRSRRLADHAEQRASRVGCSVGGDALRLHLRERRAIAPAVRDASL